MVCCLICLVTSGILKAEEIAGCKFLDLFWLVDILPQRAVGNFTAMIDTCLSIPTLLSGFSSYAVDSVSYLIDMISYSCLGI